MIAHRLDLATRANDHQPLEPIATKPMQLALKPGTVFSAATRNDVFDGFSLDREEIL
jgi:hypothetical protein